MADAQQQEQELQIPTTFPAPPLFFKDFTPENIARIEDLRTAQAEGKSRGKYDAATSLPVRLLDLPPELRCLQPPEPPANGMYRCFGIDHNLVDQPLTLEQVGITQLYTPPSTPSPTAGASSSSAKHADRAFILKRLAKSLLLNFLELLGVLSIDASQHAEKIEDLRVLFVNFHHLLNEYRPHQARESLILMMQDQLERSRRETEGILRMKGEVEGLLEGLGSAKLREREEEQIGPGNELEEEGKEVWEEVWKTFGGGLSGDGLVG